MTDRELLIRAGRACQEFTRKPLRKYGLHPGQDDTLIAIGEMKEPIGLTPLAARIPISLPGLTKAVRSLVAMQLAVVGRVVGDGRMRTVALTDKGRKLVGRVQQIHEQVDALIHAGVVMAPGTLANKLEAIIVALEPKKPKRKRG